MRSRALWRSLLDKQDSGQYAVASGQKLRKTLRVLNYIASHKANKLNKMHCSLLIADWQKSEQGTGRKERLFTEKRSF